MSKDNNLSWVIINCLNDCFDPQNSVFKPNYGSFIYITYLFSWDYISQSTKLMISLHLQYLNLQNRILTHQYQNERFARSGCRDESY